jgi:alcohol oxidase
VQPGRPTHGYTGPVKVSTGGQKLGICEEFIRVGMTYHKRPYSDDTDDLETCNTYSVSFLILIPCLHSLIKAVSAMGEVSIFSYFIVD